MITNHLLLAKESSFVVLTILLLR